MIKNTSKKSNFFTVMECENIVKGRSVIQRISRNSKYYGRRISIIIYDMINRLWSVIFPEGLIPHLCYSNMLIGFLNEVYWYFCLATVIFVTSLQETWNKANICIWDLFCFNFFNYGDKICIIKISKDFPVLFLSKLTISRSI